jgi:hypothetical protein
VILRLTTKFAFFAILLQFALLPYTWGEDLPLLTIKEMYLGEEKGESLAAPQKLIQYLRTPEEKKSHQLKIKNGIFYGPNDYPFDSSPGKFTYAEGEGVDHWSKAIIVLDDQDNLYFSLDKVEYQFHHSSLAAGNPVKFAGDVYVKNGKLIKFTNNSGHYKPSVKHVHQFMQYLETNGVDVTQVQFDLNQGSFKAFFDSKPNAKEVQQLADYTLEEALRYISKHPGEVWFDEYKIRIQDALKKNPKGLKHLLNTLDTKLSVKAADTVAPLLELHSNVLFDSKQSLDALNNHFSADVVQQTLQNKTKNILNKANGSGLSSLSPFEIQTIGLTQKNKPLPWVDAEMLKLVSQSEYAKRINAEHLPDLYTNMRLWSLNHFEEFVDKTVPPSQTVPNQGKCNLFGFMKKIFKK